MRYVAVLCALSLAPSALALTLDERIDILWGRADRQIDFGRSDDALQSALWAVEIAPDSADAWALLAHVRWYHPDVPDESAEEAARHALALDTGSARAHYALGIALWYTADLETALAEMGEAVRLNRNLARAWSMLGLMRIDAEDAGGGIEALQVAEEIGPDYYEWPLNLAEGLVAVGRLDEAIEAGRRSVELAFSPQGEALACNNLAWTICLAGADEVGDEAIASARRAAELIPTDPYYWDTLGSTLMLFGDPAEAEEPLRKALQLGHFVEPTLAYVVALHGRDAEARELLRSVSELLIGDDASVHHLYFAGLARDEIGEPVITRRIFARAVERWPERPWATQMRAWLEGH